MQLSPFGLVVETEWLQTAVVRPNVELDEFVIMPNHVHGIIVLTNTVGATRRVAPTTRRNAPTNLPNGPTSGSIGAIIGQFKSIVTKGINAIRDASGTPVWQRDFHDRIIHDEESLNNIRQYIAENPLRWGQDPENPTRISL